MLAALVKYNIIPDKIITESSQASVTATKYASMQASMIDTGFHITQIP
jgi:hypothetical protein